METNDIYLNRLIKFARFIGKEHLKEVLLKKERKYQSDKSGAAVEHFSWAVQSLQKIFKNWHYNNEGIAKLKGYENMNSLTAAAYWFDLNFDTLAHIFLSGYQDTFSFGGK